MFSFITSIFNYFFKLDNDNGDCDKEDFLAEQLFDLELSNEIPEKNNEEFSVIPRNVKCFQCTGVITDLHEYDYVLIDGMLYCDISKCSINIAVNDKVLYLAYYESNDRIVVVRILENLGISWGAEETVEINDFNVIDHIIVGEVSERQDRNVYINESDTKFCLDDVESTFVPIQGDWLELNCKVQWDENKPSDISSAQVLQVIAIRPLRKKVKKAIVTEWFGESGTLDRNIFFNRECLKNNIEPQVGAKAIAEIIESNQQHCTWRAIKFLVVETAPVNQNEPINISDDEQNSLMIEKQHNIEITHPIVFDQVKINSTAQLKVSVINNSDDIQFVNKWIILSKKRDSQVSIEPYMTRPKKLFPKESFTLNITCKPKFLGKTKECLIIMLKGIQAKRFINITVVNEISLQEKHDSNVCKTNNENIEALKKIRMNNNELFLPGVKPYKRSSFVSVKLGNFPIPEKIWGAVLGDSEQAAYSTDYEKIINRLEETLPCLLQELNINNYIDRWHTLIHMEEIQSNINMRRYDMKNVYLLNFQEYLGLEIKNLAEQRPSLIKGDRVVVKDSWRANTPLYEGFIHAIKGDFVLMKFNQRFHETYSGSDVSIEFHSGRSIYKRCHHAINLALSNLGSNILFPRRISPRQSRLPQETLNNIQWFNESLNVGQKSAICNVLSGECCPLPYCIFGPPGTGKTVTVIETILQILRYFPDSRILVATPSNSAANLITERLLIHRKSFSESLIRLIAHYLVDTDSVPEIIKPYCATMDIAKEFSNKSAQAFKNGINTNCQLSYIGRHRVTIGTCFCIGTLVHMGLPKGHFTHVIVDEAGQATEPEIMIPLTFTDKENGQIILAGDPKQLGPVIMSIYCKQFGMKESYLSRIMDTFPYQKDYAAFKNGYDQRLITKLTDNYRSLDEVIGLSSKMFYDSSLVAKIDRSQPWIQHMLEVVNEMFCINKKSEGGIFVHGIRGCNTRSKESPSWYNPQEASMVALTTCKLYKKNVAVDDIGIITPYVAQIKYLKLVFEAMGLPQPKIGTVEDFQGQERPIILITTVRSTETYLIEDQRNFLGFVKNSKRLNVALTRAQVASVLFCDPHLLCKDKLWNQVVTQAVKEDKYIGCDLPYQISNMNNIEKN